jgi:hypothetical protein
MVVGKFDIRWRQALDLSAEKNLGQMEHDVGATKLMGSG